MVNPGPVSAVASKIIQGPVKGEGVACKHLRRLGDGVPMDAARTKMLPVLGCAAGGPKVECPFAGERTLSGQVCTMHGDALAGQAEQPSKMHFADLGIGSLAMLKAHERPGNLARDPADCISADHGGC